MFGIGMTELIVILVIALLVIGPDKLPELARTLGKGLAEFKRTAEDFRNTIHEDLKAEEEKSKLLKKVDEQIKPKDGQQAGEPAPSVEPDQGPVADEAPPSPSIDHTTSDDHV
ncbi:MAG: Sec-independent protein translocase protein TatB [bacterium]